MRKLLVFAGLVFAGCVSNLPGGNGASGGSGNIDNGGNGSGMMDPGCGKMTFPIGTMKSEPNVMMVVDESGSMTDTVPGTNMSKWDSLEMAVQSLLSKYDGAVNWGLSVFPHPGGGGNSCTPGQVDVPVGPNNSTKILGILSMLNNNNIGGNTPTEQTLAAVAQGGGLGDHTHNNYVLLMTDGLPNCGSDGQGVQQQIANLYGTAPSVKTFVVGIGDGTQSNPQTLNNWATAGHTARMGSPLYYQANNVTDLQNAFGEIAGVIASCTYQLGQKPDDPSLLTTYLGGKAVPIDPNNGVTYDPGSTSIIFHGSACDQVKSGAAASVDVVYGCPSPTIQ
jgi:hypothetical protein